MKNYQPSQRRYRAATIYLGATLVSCFAAASIVACALSLLPDAIAGGAVVLAILAVSACLIVYGASTSRAGEVELSPPLTIAHEGRAICESLSAQLVKAQLVNPEFGSQPAKLDGCRSERIRVLQSWPVDGDDIAKVRRRYRVAANIDTSLPGRGHAPGGTCSLPPGLSAGGVSSGALISHTGVDRVRQL
ncbi:hypothetical protein [Paraburkholderia megapolitana]|uniref:Lipoprotein n=1 Tax=Paraburkholderia megapolitana TaxID=420953 RepID=A0A1I3W8B2_9BURK|nr:hypothetical protein [Paraburkholderia megapolitana]QDQ82242.1 hypothetical protein FNZ07_13170 [Paraburkholderia megapolitana]SFK03725.1 hypothetical protein SAMN05192543_1179 [Paraburkholderia megapolitana]